MFCSGVSASARWWYADGSHGGRTPQLLLGGAPLAAGELTVPGHAVREGLIYSVTVTQARCTAPFGTCHAAHESAGPHAVTVVG